MRVSNLRSIAYPNLSAPLHNSKLPVTGPLLRIEVLKPVNKMSAKSMTALYYLSIYLPIYIYIYIYIHIYMLEPR